MVFRPKVNAFTLRIDYLNIFLAVHHSSGNIAVPKQLIQQPQLLPLDRHY